MREFNMKIWKKTKPTTFRKKLLITTAGIILIALVFASGYFFIKWQAATDIMKYL